MKSSPHLFLFGLIAGAATLYTLVGGAAARPFQVVAGKYYRFVVRITPRLPEVELDSFLAQLRALNLTNVKVSLSDAESTRVIYEGEAGTTRELRYNGPFLALGPYTLTFLEAREIPNPRHA